MTTIFDVAKYILHKEGKMSTWKLQKLCYYSQAWSLAWTEKPLFEEDFQAWANGPVCPDLFHKHKGMFLIEEKDIEGETSNIQKDDQETIDIVLENYGNKEPYDLRELSHSEKPWQNARIGCAPDGPCSNVITKESLGAFYGSL